MNMKFNKIAEEVPVADFYFKDDISIVPIGDIIWMKVKTIEPSCFIFSM
jgi:hypothetical protein